MHQSFVSTAPTVPPMGNSRGQSLSLHHSPAKYTTLQGQLDRENSNPTDPTHKNWVKYKILVVPAILVLNHNPGILFSQYCGSIQKVIAPHISPLYPTLPHGWVGVGTVDTHDWCIKFTMSSTGLRKSYLESF